jgi:transcriptional regulator with XRE-family HTH domain
MLCERQLIRTRARAEAAKALHSGRYGPAIAKLRLRIGLQQSQIAGLSERQVRRIEKGECTTYESLRRLASAHRMDLQSYLRELAAHASDPVLERAIA